MKVTIEFDTDGAAFEDDFEGQVADVAEQIRRKVLEQSERKPCLCTHPEAADVVLDRNGNRIGSISVSRPTPVGPRVKFEQTLVRCGEATCTGRVYPRAVWEKAIASYQKAVKERRAFGPIQNGELLLRKVGFLVTNLQLDGDDVKATIEPLSNSVGDYIAGLLKSGKFVLRPAGMGTVLEGVVQNDYVLTGLSIESKDVAEEEKGE